MRLLFFYFPTPLLSLLTILGLCSSVAYGQTTIFSEDFNGYPDGTTVGTNWDASLFNNCDSEPGPNGTGWSWGVFGGQFVMNDIEGLNCCLDGNIGDNSNTINIGPINISGFLSIEINFDFIATGDYECEFIDNGDPCPGADAVPHCGSFGGHDQAIFSYSIDGGTPIVFGYWCGDQFCYGADFFCGDVSGNSLDIIITAGNQANSETYELDNIEVIGFTDPVAEAEANGMTGSITICEGDDLDLDEVGGEATSWMWTGPDGFSDNTQNPSISNVTASMAGDYEVFIETAAGCTSSNTVTVNIDSPPNPGIPDDILVCFGISPFSVEILNLDDIIDQLTGFDPSNMVEWWFDAAATNPFDFSDPSDLQALILSGQTTLFATVSDGNCTSPATAVSLQLDTYPEPDTDIGSLTECDSGGGATFDLTEADDQFTGGDGSLIVSYHETQQDAEDNEDAITTYTSSNDEILFVRIENSAGCAAYAELELIVGTASIAEDATLQACDSGNGTASFDLTDAEGTILNGQPGFVVFYEDIDLDNEINTPDDFISGNNTVFAVIDDGADCISDPAEVDLILISFDATDVFLSVSPTSACGTTDVDITLNTPSVPSGDYTFDINHGPAGNANTNTQIIGSDGELGLTLSVSEDYEIILNSVTSPAPDFCEHIFSPPLVYTVTITNMPQAFPASLALCDQGDDEAEFNLFDAQNTINGGSGLAVDFYEDNSLSTPINTPDTYTSGSTTVFANIDDGCPSNTVELELIVNPLPELEITITDPISCNGESDGSIELSIVASPTFDIDWSEDAWDGQTVINNVGAGTYLVDVTDGNFCISSSSITVNEPPVLVLDCHQNGAGEGNGLGSYSFTYSGGTPFYVLDLDGPIDINFTVNTADTWNTAVLPAGDYTFTLTDANGCEQSCSFTINPDCDLSLNCANATNTSGAGNADGSIELNISGGTTPYNITWTNSDTGAMDNTTSNMAGPLNINNLVAGNYTVVITDAMDCEASCNFVIADPVPCNFMVELLPTHISCAGETDGSIAVNLIDGVPDYTFEWSDPSLNSQGSSAMLNNLAAGLYTLTVTDANNCVAIDSINITEPAAIDLNCQVNSHPTSMGATDGAINIVINNGPTGAYTISYDNGSGTAGNIMGAIGNNTISNLPEGTYQIQVTNGSCDAICQVTLNAGACTFALSTIAQNESCIGANDGVATAVAPGGNPPYSFLWSPGMEATASISNLTPGTYTVTATDGAGCTANASVTINAGAPLPTFSHSNTSNVICADSCITIPITLTGQAPFTLEYEVIIDDMAQFIQLPINSTQHELEICPAALGIIMPSSFQIRFTALRDFNCDITLDETIDFNYLAPAIGNYTETLCVGDSLVFEGTTFNANLTNGQVISSTPSAFGCDSLVNVSVSFFPQITGSLDTTICTGESFTLHNVLFDANNTNQQITIPNATNNGCDSLLDVNVSFFPQITGSLDTTICTGESFTLHNVLFDANNTNQQITIANATSDGCDSLLDVNVNFFPQITGLLDTTICTGESFTLHNVLFDANNTNQQITIANATSNGCDSLLEVNVNFFAPAVSTIEQDICEGETLFIAGQAFGANMLSGDVVLANAAHNGCDSTISVNLTLIDDAFGHLSPDLCAGDSIDIEGQIFHQNFLQDTILLNTPSAMGCDSFLVVNINLLPIANNMIEASICPGDSLLIGGVIFNENHLNDFITLAGTAANGCDSILEVSINVLATANFNQSIQLCEGDSLMVGSEVLNTAGTHITVLENMAANGCDSIVTTELSFYAPAVENLTPTLCANETLEVGGQIFDINTPTGMVVLEGASHNGCDSTVTVAIDFLALAMHNIDSTLCFGESLTVGGQLFDANNPSGSVVLNGAAANGCDSIIQVNTSYMEQQTASLIGEGPICPQETTTITLNTSGNFTYDYSINISTAGTIDDTNQTGNQNITTAPLASTTTYTLTNITADNGCAVDILQASALIEVSLLDVNATVTSNYNGFDVSCAMANDGSATALVNTGIAPFTYQWSNGSTAADANNLAAGTYTVSVSDAAGCTTTADVTLNEPLAIQVAATGVALGCYGQDQGFIQIDTIINGTAPYEYSIDGTFFEMVQAYPTSIHQLAANNYELQIQDANDCINSITINVPQAEELILNLGDDETIELGDSILLNPSYNFTPAEWTWTPEIYLSQADTFITYTTPTETTIYQLVMQDANGCTVSDIIRIFVEKDVAVYIPSGFSPNGDGDNDQLVIYAGEGVERIESFKIFDRWGEIVFEKNSFAPNNPDPEYSWDGKLNGKTLNPAVFVYYAEVLLDSGEVILLTGDITLVR